MDDDDEISRIEEAAVRYGKFMTPETYLEWELRQQEKHEYLDGAIIAMAGASPDHHLILANVIGSLWQSLEGKPCQIFPSDLKVFVKSRQSYFYPDASIVCGDPEYADDRKHVIKNPGVIFEILSPSTEDYDLGRKSFFYMQIDALKELITIDSTKMEIRIGRRQEDNSWKFDILNSAEDILKIESAGIHLPLHHIYKGLKW